MDINISEKSHIYVGLGANLDHPVYGSPVNTLTAAVAWVSERNIKVLNTASWYTSAPVPVSDQPWFINTVIRLSFSGTAEELLAILHAAESEFGRVRHKRWEARVIDLDLLCFGNVVTDNKVQSDGLVLPHPEMMNRAFVLEPLAEIAPDWAHPVTRESAKNLLSKIGGEQQLEKFTK